MSCVNVVAVEEEESLKRDSDNETDKILIHPFGQIFINIFTNSIILFLFIVPLINY